SSRRRHTRFSRDWSSDVCSSDLAVTPLSPSERFSPSSFSVLRPTSASEAPASPSARAMASPRPPLAPTSTATLPPRSIFKSDTPAGGSTGGGGSRAFAGLGPFARLLDVEEQPHDGSERGDRRHEVDHRGPVVARALEDDPRHDRG